MKEQQSILYVIRNGKSFNFERFPYKTTESVLNWYREGVKSCSCSLFMESYFHADCIEIWRTPPKCKEYLLASYTSKDFLHEIGYSGQPRFTDKEFAEYNWQFKPILEEENIKEA